MAISTSVEVTTLSGAGLGGGGLTPTLVTASPLNATEGNLYIIDTATIGGPAIANLPALPSNGDQIAFCDGSGSDPNSPSGFGTNTLTINPDAAHDIQGYSSLELDNENEGVWLAYDSTLLSWRIVTSSAPGGGGGGGGGSAAVGARVELSGNQNVPDATDTALSWGTEIQDDDNFWDVGQPTRLTANTTGWHMVVGNVVTEFFSNTSDDGSLFIRKNGAGFVAYAREVTANLSASFIVNVSALVYLNATDYVELWWSLNSGAARDVLQDPRTSFSITRLPLAGGGGGGSSTVGESAFVRRVTNQTIANAADTAMSFDTEDSDDANYWDIGQPTRFTIPADGVYLVEGHVRWTANASGRRTIKIFVNGVTTSGVGGLLRYNGFTGADNWQQVSTPMRLSGGDYVELFVDQLSGGNLDVIGNANYGAYFSIVRLS